MARICVFDVNETLLDLHALDPQFALVFGDASVRQAWFTQMLQSAFVTTITGPYRDFGTIGAAALDMVAARRGVSITQEEKTAILSEMRRLPPHPDARAHRFWPGGLAPRRVAPLLRAARTRGGALPLH